MCRISVICSLYNASQWLDGYLEAVNNQFEQNFEIVFIDADSTDNSLQIINTFKFREGIEVKIITNEKRIGIYAAWNIGIKACKGKYIMNWNTDDLLYPSAGQIYSQYSQKKPEVDLFYGPCFTIGSQSFDHITGLRNWPKYSHEILSKICLCGPFPLIRKSSIEKCGFFEEKYLSSGDYEMWLNMSRKGFCFERIPEVVGCFHYREDSVSVKNLNLAQAEDKEIQNTYK